MQINNAAGSRAEYYDRAPTPIAFYGIKVGVDVAGTVLKTYTVPVGKKAKFTGLSLNYSVGGVVAGTAFIDWLGQLNIQSAGLVTSYASRHKIVAQFQEEVLEITGDLDLQAGDIFQIFVNMTSETGSITAQASARITEFDA